MKKLFVWVGVILITFTFGVFATLAWLKFDETPPKTEESKTDLPILAVCELVNNPDKYNEQKVRLSADLYWYMHGYFFQDVKCSGKDESTRVAIIFDSEKREQIFQQIREIQGKQFMDVGESIDLIVIGKFRKVKIKGFSDGIDGRTPLHFEIIKIEIGYLEKRKF